MTREEAVRRIKAWNLDSDDLEVLSVVIPELRNKDERIRTALYNFFKDEYKGFPRIGKNAEFSIGEILEWFEKKKNPATIQWTGDNLREVVSFTGVNTNFNKWFDSWDEYESYVHSHDDIFKIFNENGSHYEVPVGAWIVKTPDGYNVASKATFVGLEHKEEEIWDEEDEKMFNILIGRLDRFDEWAREKGYSEGCTDKTPRQWLEEMRERHRYKPCEGDMKALKEAFQAYYRGDNTHDNGYKLQNLHKELTEKFLK